MFEKDGKCSPYCDSNGGRRTRRTQMRPHHAPYQRRMESAPPAGADARNVFDFEQALSRLDSTHQLALILTCRDGQGNAATADSFGGNAIHERFNLCG